MASSLMLSSSLHQWTVSSLHQVSANLEGFCLLIQ
jgi:hypothetical protein